MYNNGMKKVILEILNKDIATRDDLLKAKREICKKHGISMIKNSELTKVYKELVDDGKMEESYILERILRKRSIRTLSGIASVSVLTRPFGCPENCAYCPTEELVPKSYLSNEPAVMRAIRHEYDPYNQVQGRIKSLIENGHSPTKIELIVIGGTWSALPDDYRYWYIKECFRGANDFNLSVSNKTKNTTELSVTALKQELDQEKKRNENSEYRIIGLTLETRPDWININELEMMREMGCTRVEIGVQMIDEAILEKNRRGHGVQAAVDATKMLRDWGFKITYHWMPGLPGSNVEMDIEKFKVLYNDARFQPDQIKFYPTVVTKGSKLYEWWRDGEYNPYSSDDLEKIIVECKKVVPVYTRIIRLIRDIPGESIIAGNRVTNLRQVMQQRGVKCKCIRCREPRGLVIENYELRVKKYEAAGGHEYFISYESEDDKLLGFCRLRIPDLESEFTPEFLRGAALVRELHVYGELSGLSEKKNVQHRGIGKKLIEEAERIIKEKRFKKIAVISGVGVRGYYEKLGYELKDEYMMKIL